MLTPMRAMRYTKRKRLVDMKNKISMSSIFGKRKGTKATRKASTRFGPHMAGISAIGPGSAGRKKAAAKPKAVKEPATKKKVTKKKASRKVAGGASSLLSGRIGGARRKATQKRNSRVAGGRAQALAKRIKRARGR